MKTLKNLIKNLFAKPQPQIGRIDWTTDKVIWD